MKQNVQHIMRQVLLALVPGIAVMLWLFGWGTLSNLLLCISFSLVLEALALWLRQRPIKPFLNDYSAVVTATLLALALPPFSPWWLIAIACIFSIVIAKHLYGGLGQNPFNPAMVAYAAMLISYPLAMTQWPPPFDSGFGALGFMDMWQQVFIGHNQWDAFTTATALDSMKQKLDWDNDNLGYLAAQGWEGVNLAFLLGGLWLWYRGIISWHIPAALMASLAGIASLFWLIDPSQYLPPWFHLFSGATMLGAFFIATDPVSASTTPIGKLIYAAGIGFFVYIIRTWGGYPDAIAFSVLIMNMAVPLLDYYTQPRVYGHKRGAL